MAGIGTDSREVMTFMANFAKLKAWVDDDPANLVSDAIRDESIAALCDKLWFNAWVLSEAEKQHPELFSGPVNPSFLTAWRDYERRYKHVVGWVSACVTLGGLTEGEDLLFDLTGEPPRPPTWEDLWARSNLEAADRVLAMDIAIDFADQQIRQADRWTDDQQDWVDEVTSGVELWSELPTRMGINLQGMLRRRALVPFVLVPRKIANQQSSNQRTAVLRNLSQAQAAFVFGTLDASLALMRATVEVILNEHYNCSDGKLEEKINSVRFRLPNRVLVDDLHSLRISANQSLHAAQAIEVTDETKSVMDNELRVSRFLITVRSLVEAVK